MPLDQEWALVGGEDLAGPMICLSIMRTEEVLFLELTITGKYTYKAEAGSLNAAGEGIFVNS